MAIVIPGSKLKTSNFYAREQIDSKWKWGSDHINLDSYPNMKGKFVSKQNVIEEYSNFLDAYFRLCGSVFNYLNDQFVPVFLFLQHLYEFSVELNDATNSVFSNGFPVNLWQQLQTAQRLRYKANVVYADIATVGNSTSWLSEIWNILPTVVEGDTYFDRANGHIDGSLKFKCPHGKINNVLFTLMEPANPADLMITEAYLNHCRFSSQNKFYFDREKSQIQFRNSRIIGLSRKFDEQGDLFWELTPLKANTTATGTEGQYTIDHQEGQTWNVPIAWWLELKPYSKQEALKRIVHNLETTIYDDTPTTDRKSVV